jgi:hypothetical protein
MTGRVIAAAVVMLALGGGIAVAATQTAASDGTNICVNDTNGLLRAAETCREGEHALTIGGGGGTVRVTQNGSFSVAWGATGPGKVLPLTGATISGRCEVFSAPFGGDGANARVLVEAPAGKTMDFFPGDSNASPSGVSSILLPPAASFLPGMGKHAATEYAILTARGATATLTIGGYVDPDSQTCNYLWQAVEAPN